MYEALKSVTDILRRRLDHLGLLPHTNERELAEVEGLLEIIERSLTQRWRTNGTYKNTLENKQL